MATAIANNIRLKRVYDPPSPDDGHRILTMRYWPRGIARSKVDEYITKTAPSKELLHAFLREGLKWEPYADAYLAEMQGDEAQNEIARLAKLARSRKITLMCGCEDESHCHRSLLRRLIIKAS